MPVINSPYPTPARAAPPSVISFTPRVIGPNRFPFGRLVDVKNSSTSPSLDWQEPTDRCRRTSFAQHSATAVVDSMRCRPGGSIDMLPDDVLLEIFDFLVEEEVVRPFRVNIEAYIEEWQTLVHVCRRWRSLVFESPRRLNLRLFCSNRTPARDTLDVWPALPLVIKCIGRAEIVDNVIAVLERSDRVCHICLTIFERSYVGELSAAMQAPFPKLIVLVLHGTVSALPNSFLGGSAPRLEHLTLRGIPFPGLPKLLLSATNLLRIFLDDIPHSGYFSPEAIVTALSTLTCLDTLRLHFESPQSRPDPERQHPPPPTRSVLTNLGSFQFKGDSEYLEVVVAHIDAPRLKYLETILFNDIVFETPQSTQFISRTLTVEALETAHVIFKGDAATVEFSSLTSGNYETLRVKSYARCWIGKSRLWSRSLLHAYLPFPLWTSTSTGIQIIDNIGKATSKMRYGCDCYTHLHP